MLVIFDFDGTIVESMPLLELEGIRHILGHYDVKYASHAREMYRQTIGLSFREQLSEMFPDRIYGGLNDYVAKSFQKRQEEIYEEVKLCPHTEEALTLLRDEGILCGMCSSSPRSLTGRVRNRLLPGLIQATKGREDGSKLTQLKRYFRRIDGYFIGDAIRDGTYAALAGVSFIGVTGTFPKSDFRTAGYRCSPNILDATHEVLRSLRTQGKTDTVSPPRISAETSISSRTSA